MKNSNNNGELDSGSNKKDAAVSIYVKTTKKERREYKRAAIDRGESLSQTVRTAMNEFLEKGGERNDKQ